MRYILTAMLAAVVLLVGLFIYYVTRPPNSELNFAIHNVYHGNDPDFQKVCSTASIELFVSNTGDRPGIVSDISYHRIVADKDVSEWFVPPNEHVIVQPRESMMIRYACRVQTNDSKTAQSTEDATIYSTDFYGVQTTTEIPYKEE